MNCEKRIYASDHPMGLPKLEPCHIDLEDGVEMIGFNYVKTDRNPAKKIVHFFIDDYQFERVWNKPTVYIDMLKKYRAVIMPDFSTYTDFPQCVQVFNHYRNLWLARFWKDNGVTVIPNINWSDESSFEWVFDSVPKHSTVCLSSVGCIKRVGLKDVWLKGYAELRRRCEPEQILIYGNVIDEIKDDAGIVHGKPAHIERLNERKAMLNGKDVLRQEQG